MQTGMGHDQTVKKVARPRQRQRPADNGAEILIADPEANPRGEIGDQGRRILCHPLNFI